MLLGSWNRISLSHEQVLRERPLLIYPLHFAAETRLSRRFAYLIDGILVAALRPDGLTLPELNHHLRRRNTHNLPALRKQMHFHATLFYINPCHMLEFTEVEISSQLPIDSSQQIQIECRRHPKIVVRSEEHTSELQSHVNLVCRLLLEK